MDIKRFILGFCCASTLLSGNTNAGNVLAGSEYLETIFGSAFSLDSLVPGFGAVYFVGVPIDPVNLGTTDTIVTRLEDAVLPQQGSSATINIQMEQLSLQSAAPISVLGNLYNIIVSLDPILPSLGQMIINHEELDNGTDSAEGTFDSWMYLNLDLKFEDLNGLTANDFVVDFDNLYITSIGTCWSHTLTGEPKFAGQSNFFITKCPDNLGDGITTYAYLNGGPVVDNPLTQHFPGWGLPGVPGVPGIPKVNLKPFGVIFEDTDGLLHCVRLARAVGVPEEVFCGPGDGPVELPKVILAAPEPPILFLFIPALLGLFASRKLVS